MSLEGIKAVVFDLEGTLLDRKSREINLLKNNMSVSMII